MLLVLLMAISLLSSAAFAEGPNEPGPNESDSLYLNKSYDPATGMLTIETYAKGETVTVEKTQPCDIVLVLDVSGSMSDPMPNSQSVGYYDPITWNWGRPDYDYSQMDPTKPAGYYSSYFDGLFGINEYYAPLRYSSNNWQISKSGRNNDWVNVSDAASGISFFTGEFTFYRSKLGAMMDAANAFIDTVKANAAEDDVDHRISIVKFAGDNSDAVGNNFYGSNLYNNSQVMVGLTSVNDAGAVTLHNNVNQMWAAGATAADFGMTHAKNILDGVERDSGKVVVLFTDGEPNHQNGFDDSVANAAVRTSRDLKADGVKVYTVGVFGDPSDEVLQYMNAVSSNYKDASSYEVGDTRIRDNFLTADTPEKLSTVFTQIAEEIGGSFVDLNEQSTVVDQMSSYFKLDGVTATDISKVEVYTANCIGEENGKLKFADPVRYTGADITVTNGDTVNVSGFDFSENWVGKDASNNYRGKKLIIKFPVQPKEGVEGLVPTNSSASGVYDEDGKPVQEYPVPEYEVGALSKVIDFNGKMILARDADAPLYATSNNGTFGLDGTSAYYQLRNDGLKASTKADSAVLNSDYSGVDTAMIFGKFGTDTTKQWKNVTAIPASNIYYSDNLTDATLAANDQIGYNEGVTYVAPTAETANKTYSFTFTGSRIDVYATTTSGTKTVTATLYQNGEKVQEKMVNTKVPTDATRVSAPSVSFDGLSGTYTLEIFANVKANFLLEAVRVYNANEANAEAEPNARYINLRDMVLNKESAQELTNDTPNAVLFMDEVKNENPYQEGTEKYQQFIPQTYEALGPKNEVYLAPGQAIGFEVDSGVDVMVSLRSPETESGTVMINGAEQAVTNVDMYYPVTLDDGVVMISNESDAMISVINVKLTSAEADGARALIFSSPKLLARAAHYVAPAAVEVVDEPASDFSAIVKQLLTDFVRTLFSSISRLFGN